MTDRPTSESRTWAIVAHLLPLVSLGIIGPLVVYLIKKNDDEFAAHHAREALNFQITLLLAVIVSVILVFVVIGFFLLFVVAIGGLVLMIIAAVRASDGEYYSYPWTLRLVR